MDYYKIEGRQNIMCGKEERTVFQLFEKVLDPFSRGYDLVGTFSVAGHDATYSDCLQTALDEM
jgi:hypothetical protein